MRTLIYTIAFAVSSLMSLFAQQLPVDPEVKTGTLENGMTYYIRRNVQPKERADFYLACNVGAVLEEDHENGLAHFVEHTAFNGSKNFKGNGVIDYLRTIGIKFGENLNATTYPDRTVYRIADAPVTQDEVVDTCLLILHDWAACLSMDDKEIEKERGVIREEMRMVMNHERRSRMSLMQQIMPENQYARRSVIGTEEIIMNFEPETLHNFYRRWYRPDLQAVIVVGDIDPEMMEKKIRNLFSTIPAPVNPVERKYYPVQDNEAIQVAIAADKEAPYATFYIDYKHQPLSRMEKSTVDGLATDYINALASYMSYSRLQELMDQPEPPFTDGIIQNDLFMQTAAAETWQGAVIVRDDNYETGLKALAREMERINRFGFTASEYEIAKLNYFSAMESALDQQTNNQYALEYVEHFLEGGYIPGIRMQYEITKQIATQISLEMVNGYIQELMDDKNIVISLTAPLKEGSDLPTKDLLLTWFTEVKNEELAPYQDKVSGKILLPELPTGGKIVSETVEDTFGTTLLTLNNGVKVVIKPTALKDDEILVQATSPGGTSHFPETEPVNIALFGEAFNLGGVGEFSNRELTMMLAGKNATVAPVINTTTEGFTGSSGKRDFETMLQLIYLHFTAPRMDNDAFQSFINRKKSELQGEGDIIRLVSDSLRSTAYINPERHPILKATDLDRADYTTIMEWRKDRYSDAGDFTFVFTGSIDPQASKEMIARYLGALPSSGRAETHREITDGYRTGHIRNIFSRKMEIPQAMAVRIYPAQLELTLHNQIKANMLAQIIDMILKQKIREERSDVYSINTSANPEEYPKGLIQFQINYFTEPGKEESINKAIDQIISQLSGEGPQQAYLLKAKEFMLMNRQNREQLNDYWAEILTGLYAKGYNAHTGYQDIVNSITPGDIKEVAGTILQSGNLIEVMMIGSSN